MIDAKSSADLSSLRFQQVKNPGPLKFLASWRGQREQKRTSGCGRDRNRVEEGRCDQGRRFGVRCDQLGAEEGGRGAPRRFWYVQRPGARGQRGTQSTDW